ncbi:MAG TPA: multifunctional CCA addition/repair protein [Gammaproteobacteria bacterium]|nr:multifunctional CCA addition/repair protein [Gammaproteobacteria bacterium]|tara:strand:+ start:207 stop:1463 length:1257 start_codon:yes stop_codon:yes gene_type:complete
MADPCDFLECYLVGGAVRDALLNKAAGDRDWVVIGASPEDMLERGFRAVGKDFPVFLHPVSGEEYALARRERKTGPGYTGFATETGSDVTLEEDLSRRDLTVNAMAQDPDGGLIDPFGGAEDLNNGILRHVSDAFVEDPLRVLRVARFAARYAGRGFAVAPETVDLMRRISASGELASLVPERVWQETCRALGEADPSEFIRVLQRCDALDIIFPEIAALQGVLQNVEHHPEGDAFVHTLMVLDIATKISQEKAVRFAALVHDLGKAKTPQNEWPRHIKHEHRGVTIVNALCDRLRVPSDYRELAVLVTREHLLMHRLAELRPETVLKLLNRLDGFRRPERLDSFLTACRADAAGRGDGTLGDYPQKPLLEKYFAAAKAVDLSDLADSPQDGRARKKIVEERRLDAISEIHQNRQAVC